MQKSEAFFRALPEADKYVVYKAACTLADRYRAERDAARGQVAKFRAKTEEVTGIQQALETSIREALADDRSPAFLGAGEGALQKAKGKVAPRREHRDAIQALKEKTKKAAPETGAAHDLTDRIRKRAEQNR
jgi:hypothetical protein